MTRKSMIRDTSGTYKCRKCGKRHKINSDIGRRHKIKKENK